MLNSRKIEIAKEFVDAHKSDIDDWQPFGVRDDEKYLTIFENLIGGVYGGRDEDTDFLVEIGSHESVTGNPIIFGVDLFEIKNLHADEIDEWSENLDGGEHE